MIRGGFRVFFPGSGLCHGVVFYDLHGSMACIFGYNWQGSCKSGRFRMVLGKNDTPCPTLLLSACCPSRGYPRDKFFHIHTVFLLSLFVLFRFRMSLYILSLPVASWVWLFCSVSFWNVYLSGKDGMNVTCGGEV